MDISLPSLPKNVPMISALKAEAEMWIYGDQTNPVVQQREGDGMEVTPSLNTAAPCLCLQPNSYINIVPDFLRYD